MSEVESSVANAAHPSHALWRQTVTWIAAPILAVPVAVLLHESGHHLMHLILGFSGSTLHYSSASYALENPFWRELYGGHVHAANALVPFWQAGLSIAAGLLVSYATIIICCYLAARRKPSPFVVAIGMAAGLRFLSVIPIIVRWISGRPAASGSDEANLAILTGVPAILFAAAGMAFLIGGWFWLIRSLPGGQRNVAAGSLMVGLVVGLVAYFQLIGPRVLP
ncbi:MAG TPA: hypothetical protein VF591_08435 [Pyrinomonadaceae bacterium]|jgi:hypothetical protein